MPNQLAYRFDEWTPDGQTLVETHAFIGDWEVAKAAWEVLIKSKPHEHLAWRHGAPWFMPSKCGRTSTRSQDEPGSC